MFVVGGLALPVGYGCNLMTASASGRLGDAKTTIPGVEKVAVAHSLRR